MEKMLILCRFVWVATFFIFKALFTPTALYAIAQGAMFFAHPG